MFSIRRWERNHDAENTQLTSLMNRQEGAVSEQERCYSPDANPALPRGLVPPGSRALQIHRECSWEILSVLISAEKVLKEPEMAPRNT